MGRLTNTQRRATDAQNQKNGNARAIAKEIKMRTRNNCHYVSP